MYLKVCQQLEGNMISVKEALQTILNNTQDFGVEEVPFLESIGRVLKEDIVADRDFPPFNRVSMDGIAINHKYFLEGNRNFPIEGIQAHYENVQLFFNVNKENIVSKTNHH